MTDCPCGDHERSRACCACACANLETPEARVAAYLGQWRIVDMVGDALNVTIERDGKRVVLVPQEAVLRHMGQQDGLGRAVGAFVGELVLGLKQKDPDGARARRDLGLLRYAQEVHEDAKARRVVGTPPPGTPGKEKP